MDYLNNMGGGGGESSSSTASSGVSFGGSGLSDNTLAIVALGLVVIAAFVATRN